MLLCVSQFGRACPPMLASPVLGPRDGQTPGDIVLSEGGLAVLGPPH